MNYIIFMYISSPMQYIISMDMLARTPAEMQAAYKHLDEMRNMLEEARNELRTFIVSTIILQAQEKLRLVNCNLINGVLYSIT